jgi:hypothetical protein
MNVNYVQGTQTPFATSDHKRRWAISNHEAGFCDQHAETLVARERALEILDRRDSR